MKLSEQDANLFFDLMWPLQYFVNQKLTIHPNIESLEEYVMCTHEEKFEVRKALYENIKLIDSFIEENPEHFSQEELLIVSEWRNFIEGQQFPEGLK